jgi:hypothetical protein
VANSMLLALGHKRVDPNPPPTACDQSGVRRAGLGNLLDAHQGVPDRCLCAAGRPLRQWALSLAAVSTHTAG